MFVAAEARGQGIGSTLLAAIENQARSLGYTRLVLETGTLQPEAIALYENRGYTRIPTWGSYANDPTALCYAKNITLQKAIRELQQLGRFPSYQDAVSDETVAQYETLIGSINSPINDAEASILCGLLGPDDFYGMAWTTVHLLETAPNWITRKSIPEAHSEWREVLEDRLSSLTARR